MDQDAQMHQQLGKIEGKLDALISTVSRAHSRVDAIEKEVSAAQAAAVKDLGDFKEKNSIEMTAFKTETLKQFTKFAEVQARHTVIVGIVSTVIAVVVANIVGGK